MSGVYSKLRIAVWVMILGMLLGYAFHYAMGEFYGLGYPFNTFLYVPAIRFSDFYDVLRSSADWDPYSRWSIYFPFTYVVFHVPASLPDIDWLPIFYVVVVTGLWAGYALMLKPATGSVFRAIVGAAVLLAASYPVLFCMDRGNIELAIVLLMLGFLFFFRRRRYHASLALLVPAMCIKLYPAVLLALFCRRGRLHHAVWAGIACFVITLGSLSLFRHTIQEDFALWQKQLSRYRSIYIVGNCGMAGSASLWGPAKCALYAVTDWQQNPKETKVRNEYLLQFYSVIMAALAIALVWHVTVVETEFWRRVALLILFLVLSAPGGADYKLVHVVTVLAALIVLRGKRRFDWLVVGLVAAVLVPKKYGFLPGIISDTNYMDASIGVIINPLLMVMAAGLLCWDGWKRSTPRGRALRWGHVRSIWAFGAKA